MCDFILRPTQVLEGEDGLATFVPKTCHRRSGRRGSIGPRGAPSFRERQFPIIRAHIVIMRVQESNEPTRPKMRRWRLTDGDSSDSTGDDYCVVGGERDGEFATG